jgi:hypothetical protein
LVASGWRGMGLGLAADAGSYRADRSGLIRAGSS